MRRSHRQTKVAGLDCKAPSTPATMSKQRSTLSKQHSTLFSFDTKSGNNVDRVYHPCSFDKVGCCFDIVAVFATM